MTCGFMQRLAPYFERLVKADLYIEGQRPKQGWPLIYGKLDCMSCKRWPQNCQKCYEHR